jgi:YidC/Oxa1 family membrane protein insertase
MEKRLGLAIALCVGFMLLWTWLFPPPKPQPPAPASTSANGPATPAAPMATNPAAPASASPGPAPGPAGVPAPGAGESPAGGTAAAGGAPSGAGQPAATRAAFLPAAATAAAAEKEINIQTPLAEIRLATKGARVTSWVLRKFKDARGAPLDLVNPAAAKLDRLPLDLLLEDKDAARMLREADYAVERKETDQEGHRTIVVTFTWNDGRGNAAAKILRVPEDSYVAELEAAAEIQGKPVTPAISWGAGFERDDEESSERLGVGARAVVGLPDRIDHRYQDKITPTAPWGEEGAILWAGLESKYFAAILVPQGAAAVRTRAEALRLVEDGREFFHLDLSMVAAGATHYHLFVGPKDHDMLAGLGLGLERLLNFGMFSIIALPLFKALKFIHHYVGNYGWAIILLTVGIRLVFFPFMHRGQLKMRLAQENMKKLQPKLKALKERYEKLLRKEIGKGTAGARARLRQEQNEEMMRLYKEEGINPFASMSGCLPLLVQMPILWGFYNILTIAIDLRQAPFMLWIHDLSVQDPLYVTPILMGGTMLAQQLMTSSAIPDPAQRRMMYVMPIMFTWFFLHLPSGLVLYWLVNNLLGIVQQYLVNKEAERRIPATT